MREAGTSEKGMAFDWRAAYTVTPEKMEELVRRIVAKGNPLQVILFGSRARGDHRGESDVDVAVVMDGPEEDVHLRLPYTVLEELRLLVDMVVVSTEKYEKHRPWLNSIFRNIDEEGIVLYDRERRGLASRHIAEAGAGRRIGIDSSAA